VWAGHLFGSPYTNELPLYSQRPVKYLLLTGKSSFAQELTRYRDVLSLPMITKV
jgi:hypothetical protein